MISDVAEVMRTAVDAVADVDLDDLRGDQLDAELVDLLLLRHRLDAEIARRAERWDARMVWRSDGSRSAAARLARHGHVARTTADHIVRSGRAVASMPATTTAWRNGDIGIDAVDLLCRAAGAGRGELFARDEWLLVEQCATLRYAQATKAIRYWIQRADAELSTDGTPPPPESYLKQGRADGGRPGRDGRPGQHRAGRWSAPGAVADDPGR